MSKQLERAQEIARKAKEKADRVEWAEKIKSYAKLFSRAVHAEDFEEAGAVLLEINGLLAPPSAQKESV